MNYIINFHKKLFTIIITYAKWMNFYIYGIICIVSVALKLYMCLCMRSYYNAWYIKQEVYGFGVTYLFIMKLLQPVELCCSSFLNDFLLKLFFDIDKERIMMHKLSFLILTFIQLIFWNLCLWWILLTLPPGIFVDFFIIGCFILFIKRSDLFSTGFWRC